MSEVLPAVITIMNFAKKILQATPEIPLPDGGNWGGVKSNVTSKLRLVR